MRLGGGEAHRVQELVQQGLAFRSQRRRAGRPGGVHLGGGEAHCVQELARLQHVVGGAREAEAHKVHLKLTVQRLRRHPAMLRTAPGMPPNSPLFALPTPRMGAPLKDFYPRWGY